MTSLELFLAQSSKLTSWLTPVWVISVGIAVGFVLVLLGLVKIYISSKIPFISGVAENKTAKLILGVLLSLVYLAIAGLAFYYFTDAGKVLAEFDRNSVPYQDLIDNFTVFLILAIPFSLFLGFGAWNLVSKRGSAEVLTLSKEGFLHWVNILCLVAVVFAVAGGALAAFNVFKVVDDPVGVLNSMGRMPFAGTTIKTFSIPVSSEDSAGEIVEVSFFGQEVKWIEFRSDQKLEISTEPISTTLDPTKIFEISPTSINEPQVYRPRGDGVGRIPFRFVDKLHVVNLGTGEATGRVTYRTGPIYNQVWLIPLAALVVVLLYAIYWVVAASFPKVFAIAYSTFKTEISQALFIIVMLIGVVFILGSIYIPYNTFGEDIKMYKDSGLTLIRVLAIFLAVWAASKSVAEEIEGRTALTVLSKPVGRRQFIFGKVLGITLAVALLFIALGAWFVIWTSYKPVYDAVESSKGSVEWTECFNEAISVIPALFLGFLEVVIFVAVSVAISTRFGILANFLICFSIYVLGHLTPLIVQSAEAAQAFETVGFFGQLIAIIFPVLNHFDVQAAINTGRPVPLVYLGWSVIYCALYSSMAMLLALVLFEDRDLA